MLGVGRDLCGSFSPTPAEAGTPLTYSSPALNCICDMWLTYESGFSPL